MRKEVDLKFKIIGGREQTVQNLAYELSREKTHGEETGMDLKQPIFS